MAETYHIRFTLKAANDLEEIFDWIEKDSPENATRLISRLLDAIDSLQLFPNRHKPVRGADVLGEQIRSMTIRPYLLRYHVDDSARAVTILSVRHGARL